MLVRTGFILSPPTSWTDAPAFTSKGLIHLNNKICFGPAAFTPKGRERRSQRLILFAFFLFAVTLWSQPNAQPAWEGVLRDTAGAPVSDAKIRLNGRSVSVDATTSEDGHFRIGTLPAGQYHLTVETNGRKVEFAQPIDVSVASPAALLTLSSRGELTVGVLTGQAATGGEQLSSEAVSELPLNGRDFGTLLLLAAGTMTDANGATNFTAQFAINGQRGVEATFAMDGADISDPEMGGSTFANFNVDAVERIDSSSGWMPAEHRTRRGRVH